jgi:hypothetical protein
MLDLFYGEWTNQHSEGYYSQANIDRSYAEAPG